MKNLTKLMIMGLLLISFTLNINSGDAHEGNTGVIILEGSQILGCEVDDRCWLPSTIAVPVGTTVEWINKDTVAHTVVGATNPDDPATWSTVTIGGKLFDSTVSEAPLIKPNAEWSFTFTEAGEFLYVCSLHPWMIGKVIITAEGTLLEGQQIDLVVNPGLPFDPLTNEKVMLTFKSKGANGKPIIHTDYSITITKDGKQVFNQKFHDHDGILELEIIPMEMDLQVSKPNVDDPEKLITGSFGVMSRLFIENGSYDIKAQITGIEFKPLPSPITQNFGLEVVPEFPLTAILPMLLAFTGMIVALRIRPRFLRN